MKFDLSGFEEIEDALAREAGVIERLAGDTAAQSSLKKSLEIIADNARSRVHSITGNLKRGIKSRVTISADSPTVGEVGISYKRSPKARHAHLVEGGHGGPHGPADPHPFWEPAVQATGQEAVDALRDVAGSLIDDMWK